MYDLGIYMYNELWRGSYPVRVATGLNDYYAIVDTFKSSGSLVIRKSTRLSPSILGTWNDE